MRRMETNWWWVRHAPTNTDRIAGWTDLPADLSDTAAIGRLSSWLPHNALVVSSDLQRASRTADAICGHRTRLADAPELREINFGEWDGLTAKEISARCPNMAKAYWSDPFNFSPPGGETWKSIIDRIAEFTTRLTAKHMGKDIVAVAHFGVILTQLQRSSDWNDTQLLASKIECLSVSRTAVVEGQWKLLKANVRP